MINLGIPKINYGLISTQLLLHGQKLRLNKEFSMYFLVKNLNGRLLNTRNANIVKKTTLISRKKFEDI